LHKLGRVLQDILKKNKQRRSRRNVDQKIRIPIKSTFSIWKKRGRKRGIAAVKKNVHFSGRKKKQIVEKNRLSTGIPAKPVGGVRVLKKKKKKKKKKTGLQKKSQVVAKPKRGRGRPEKEGKAPARERQKKGTRTG